ncbi:outer membrane protein assembly factor BamB family protein [Gallibacter intestinalis]|uniref:PQQ-binding-like beta-propeller repeat protein n=1 Tax=Gallibacter intestinalis TaxID=2779356 RepID=A0ABR9QVQ7_9FIRM|nr:PQQ-binding-like beta-propeller repeat protein [Gallibacter intestinalis]MBE5034966.1 PQQ-binding-like beta-propeller repeat protein [Gallibacter intestinalis]
MKMRTKTANKAIAFIVFVAMILSLVPYQAFAYGTKPVDNYGVDTEWYNFRNNQENNGVTETATPTDDATANLKWASKYGSGYSAAPTPPLILDDKLYVGSGNKILEIDKETGEKLRESDAMYGNVGYAMNPVLYAEGKLFVQVGNGVVQAIDLKTLKCLWHTEKIGGQTVSPISYTQVDGKGYIYTGTWGLGERSDGTYFCVAIDDENITTDTENNKGGGKTKATEWTFTPSIDDKALVGTENAQRGFYWAGAYACENYIAVGTDDGTNEGDYTANAVFYTLNPKTGKIIDRIDKIKGDIRTTVVFDNGHLYFSTKGGTLYKVDVDENGNLSNESYIDLGGMTTAAPLVYKNKIYIGVCGPGGQFNPDGGHSFKVVSNEGTLSENSLMYELPIPGYPQAAALLSTAYEDEDFDGDGKADGRVYLYFTYNANPGGIYYTYDTTEATEALDMGKELYIPEEDKQQYCISTICADDEGTLYYKNDSCYLMAVETNPAVISNIEIMADDGTNVLWNKTFDQKSKEYQINTKSTTKKLSVKLTLPDGITAEVNGQAYKENMEVDISDEDNILKITSKLGDYQRTYTINVDKTIDVSTLSLLKVNESNSFSGAEYYMTPEFDSNIKNYTVDLSGVSSPKFYRVWCDTLNPNATISVVGSGENSDNINKINSSTDNDGRVRFNVYLNNSEVTTDVDINVTSEDNTTKTTYHVSLYKGIGVSEVNLDKTKILIDVTDETQKINATISPDDAFTKKITWSVSPTKDACVSVDDEGNISAIKAGTATVTARAINGKNAKCTITVTDKALDVISKIDSLENITLESKADIDIIVAAYDDLNDKQKSRADELGYKESIKEIQDAYDKLVKEKEKEEADKAAAKAATDKINAIGTDITLDSAQAIKDARAAYDGLTSDQKTLISEESLKALESAEIKLAELEFEKTKNDAIDEIESYKVLSDYRTDQQEEIKAIISDAAGDINKAANKDEISAAVKDAKAKMDKLKTDAQLTAEEQAKKAADEVKALIDKIGSVAFNEESRDAINAAKEAYESLNDEAKALVSNLDVLESAQEKYDTIVEKTPVTAKEDKATGISVSTKFMEGAELIVNQAASSDVTAMKKAFEQEGVEIERYISTYDVHIDGGYEGHITLTFDVGNQYDGRIVAIKQMLDNGNIETYTVTVKNGEVSVTVDSLSPFVLALLEKVDIPAGDLDNEVDLSGNTTNISSDKIDTTGNTTATGDERNISDPIALMLLGAAGLIVLLITRKKCNN